MKRENVKIMPYSTRGSFTLEKVNNSALRKHHISLIKSYTSVNSGADSIYTPKNNGDHETKNVIPFRSRRIKCSKKCHFVQKFDRTKVKCGRWHAHSVTHRKTTKKASNRKYRAAKQPKHHQLSVYIS